MDQILTLSTFVCRELVIFSAVGFLIGGLDELLIDLIWIFQHIRRKYFVYRRFAAVTSDTIAAGRQQGELAIFVPAWDESAVIADMLTAMIGRYHGVTHKVFVGCYPNDPATIAAIRSVRDDRIQMVMSHKEGPTTKADCLNTLWHEMRVDELFRNHRFKAVVLHDAEDLVHPDELKIFDRLIESSALVQLPVVPVIDADSRWIAGHYCDEFAEAHCKTLVVREFLGAGVPAAGVGCAICCDALARLAESRDGDPFDVDSLTEDYELGLRLHALGEKTIFVRLPAHGEAGMVATHAHFPATLEAAVRQKTRWITGIALAGWDRLGWSGGIAERWMRLRDRRSVLAAIILTTAYVAVVMSLIIIAAGAQGRHKSVILDGTAAVLVAINMGLLFWRLAVRAYFVSHLYGWREGIRSVFRSILGNIIAIMAARRAVIQYWSIAKGQKPVWDKTAHKFPTINDMR